jgi:hypothetical protein
METSASFEARSAPSSYPTLGFTYSDADAEGVDIEQKQFGISPGGLVRFGYAATEMLEVGLDLNVSYEDLEVEGDDADGWEIAIGPYIGANFPLNDSATLYLGPILSLRYVHTEADPLRSMLSNCWWVGSSSGS